MVKPQRKVGYCESLVYSYKSFAHEDPEIKDLT